ncbi:MAG: AAA family ATPase, partial [Nocardioides sp.]
MDHRGLFGRERELAEADVALAAAAAGTPQALLVGGDAGIGKTSFVAAVSSRARDQAFTVLTGHCLDIETGEPLAPLREALRGALAGRRPETLPPVARRLEPYLSGAETGAESGLVEDLRLVVGELAGETPVLLVLEDMHWADASTRDLALALARTMAGPVLLLLTYRADDLVRRHPFRKTLVDVCRVVGAHRLDLTPLDRDGIAGIVARATGDSDPSVVGTLLARSEGNPLYAEELLGQDLTGVPVGLNDLLLARVERLGGAARSLVRLASVNGSRVDTALLRGVSGLSDVEVDACVREGVDANVLRCTDDHVDFRHGLLREAVYDDLLPGERNRAHAELATELAAMPPSGDAVGTLTRLAFHWDAANDQPRALAARLRAGVALARRGHPEALAHLERALEMWDHVDDPALRDGLTKADVLCHLATAAKVVDGDEDRAVRFIREAIRQLDPDGDRLVASRVYVAYADLCHELADELGHREAVSRALEFAEGA